MDSKIRHVGIMAAVGKDNSMQTGTDVFTVTKLGIDHSGLVKSNKKVSPGTLLGFGAKSARRFAIIFRLLEINDQSYFYECKNMRGLRHGEVGSVEGNALHSLDKTYIQVEDPRLEAQVDQLIKPFDALTRVTRGDQQDADILVTRDRCMIARHERVYAESTSIADCLFSMCTIKHFEKLRRKYKPIPRMHQLSISESSAQIELDVQLPFSAYVCIFRVQSDNKLEMLYRSPDKLLEGGKPHLRGMTAGQSDQHFVLIATKTPNPLSVFTSGLPKQPTVIETSRGTVTRLETRNIGPGYVGGKVDNNLDNVDKLDPADWYVTSTWV